MCHQNWTVYTCANKYGKTGECGKWKSCENLVVQWGEDNPLADPKALKDEEGKPVPGPTIECPEYQSSLENPKTCHARRTGHKDFGRRIDIRTSSRSEDWDLYDKQCLQCQYKQHDPKLSKNKKPRVVGSVICEVTGLPLPCSLERREPEKPLPPWDQ